MSNMAIIREFENKKNITWAPYTNILLTGSSTNHSQQLVKNFWKFFILANLTLTLTYII